MNHISKKILNTNTQMMKNIAELEIISVHSICNLSVV